MSSKLKLLVICHKQDDNIRKNAPYFPIQVGKELHHDVDLGFQNDNEGDNISERNPFWCELTGLYWGWKNIKDVDYLGLCHYRRYFKLDVSVHNIDRQLRKYDMIVVNGGKMIDKTSRARNLMSMTSKEDAYLFIDTILSLYPEYYEAVYKYFYNSRFSYPYTMFIAQKQMYDDFCEFLFPILFEVEKRLKPHGYTRLKRTIGYFGEWSLGLFILCRNLNVLAVPVEQSNVPSVPLYKRIYHWFDNRLKILFYDLCIRAPKGIIVPPEVLVGFKADGIELKALK